MTIIRSCDCRRCQRSNYFARLTEGIGHRGSSFMDIDAVTHDGATERYLIQEFKGEGEPLNAGEHWMLRGLVKIPKHFTCWLVVQREDGLIDWAQLTTDKTYTLRTISVNQYLELFRAWWERRRAVMVKPPPLPPDPPPVVLHPRVERDMVDTDINW